MCCTSAAKEETTEQVMQECEAKHEEDMAKRLAEAAMRDAMLFEMD